MAQAKSLLVVGLIIIGLFSRWLPHPVNFTAVGAVALFAGTTLRNRGLALILPVLILFLSDLALGGHALMTYVYVAMILTTALGFFIQDKNFFQKSQIFKVAGMSLSGSFLFFLITNYAVWQNAGLYPMTNQGLIECYVNGLPFFKNQVAADLLFSGVLFSTYEIVGRRWLAISSQADLKN